MFISIYHIFYLVTEDGVVTSKLSDTCISLFTYLVSQRITIIQKFIKCGTFNQYPDTFFNIYKFSLILMFDVSPHTLTSELDFHNNEISQ